MKCGVMNDIQVKKNLSYRLNEDWRHIHSNSVEGDLISLNERENSLHMYYLASMSGQSDGKHRLNFITL